MTEKHHVLLVPGFFGFANIGELLYFSHVRDYLPRACARLGLDVEVTTVQTYPTSSIRRRAERLLEVASEAAGKDDGPVHLVGHSSGGLDARLLVSPGVSLRGGLEVEPLARRVRSVVMISTPNHGTPVASFFTSLFGQKLLQLLSLGTMYVLRFGRLPSSVIFRLGAIFARMDNLVGWRNNILDELYEQLLADFSPERREALEHFLGDVGADQALLPQLTPEGMDVFNAATSDRPGVRYGCVLNYARRPGLLSVGSVGLDPYGQATHALFYGLYRLASGMPAEHVPELDDAQMEAVLSTYGIIPEREANDGLVPTISQLWGQVIHATRADHLDVLGHFSGATRATRGAARPRGSGDGSGPHVPRPGDGNGSSELPHIDWLSSGTGFTRFHFEALWKDVAAYLAGGSGAPAVSPPRSRVQHLLHLFKRRRR